ncbi:MAG: heme-copper oxidase subunit III [Kiritimatiellaeota bacterium]|nr:heme-copper oxidase subunit III [Kiritimatiellota bacterium]
MTMERNKMGMLLFVASESVFFTLLITNYIFYNHPADRAVSGAQLLNPLKSGIFSVALLSSSLTMHFAGSNAQQRRLWRVGWWLAATLALGAVFLIGQGAEYLQLLRERVTISRNMFGTTFFTLTGFHGLHVFLGLVMLAVLLGLALCGREREPSAAAVDAISIYWHFVDAVWIVIFSVIYLWAFL